MTLDESSSIHFCLVTTTDVEAVQKSDGSWTLDGFEGQQFVSTVTYWERFMRPLNYTFYATLKPNECVNRLETNQSQISNMLFPFETAGVNYFVPAVMFPGKAQFVAGFSTREDELNVKETATVFSNSDLLKREVYLAASLLIISFITFIIARVTLFYRHHLRYKSRGKLRLLIPKELSAVFYCNSKNFRLITMLYSFLCFFLMISILTQYKTSQVIVDRPYYPTSYKDCIERRGSLPLFYNQFALVTELFRDAPVDSPRGQLWKKLVKSGKQDAFTIDGSNVNPTLLPELLRNVSKSVVEDKGIAIVSSIIAPLLKSLLCGLSAEKELVHLKLLSDASEPELIYGFVFSRSYPDLKLAERSLRRRFESHISAHHIELSLEVAHITQGIAGTSKQHHRQQRLACSQVDFSPDPFVKSIPIEYFTSFIFACLGIWLFALALNVMHTLSIKNIRQRRKIRKRVRMSKIILY